jgi:hypothetical protein
MTDLQINEEEAAAHLGLSVQDFRRFKLQVDEQNRRMEEGYRRMAAEHPMREFKLQFLRPYKVTPHPHVGEKRGPWEISTFTVDQEHENIERMRAVLSNSAGGRFVVAGEYTSLLRDGNVIMSDTDDELLDMIEFHHLLGWADVKRVVINGLGLGVALKMCLAHETVEHVDVVELDENVISLADWITDDPRVHVHQGDAYTYKFPPGTKWDVAWHDIWDEIDQDNDFETLHRRYGHRVHWQGSWARGLAERVQAKREREWERWKKLAEMEES